MSLDESQLEALTRRVEPGAWPVADFDQLMAALGGEEVEITVGDRVVRIGELRAAMPAYYFPIGTEADLRAKLADAAVRGADPGRHAGGARAIGEPAAAPGGDCWS